MLQLSLPTPIETIDLPILSESGITLRVKRDDLIHPQIIGNKLRKSLHHFELARQQGHSRVITFGGRFSNHILAISQAGAALGFETIGIVRGSDVRGTSPILDACRQNGMRIVPVTTESYTSLKALSSTDLIHAADVGAAYVIPEGGTSAACLDGVADIIDEIPDLARYACIACAVGTGGTAAGLALGLERLGSVSTKVLALSVLRGYTQLPAQASAALQDKLGEAQADALIAKRINFDGSAPFGRYGRPTDAVLAELRELQSALQFPIDYVYTGKALLHILRLVRTGYFKEGTEVLFLHTGGYQTAPVL